MKPFEGVTSPLDQDGDGITFVIKATQRGQSLGRKSDSSANLDGIASSFFMYMPSAGKHQASRRTANVLWGTRAGRQLARSSDARVLPVPPDGGALLCPLRSHDNSITTTTKATHQSGSPRVRALPLFPSLPSLFPSFI